jgi:hypothetical protein
MDTVMLTVARDTGAVTLAVTRARDTGLLARAERFSTDSTDSDGVIGVAGDVDLPHGVAWARHSDLGS